MRKVYQLPMINPLNFKALKVKNYAKLFYKFPCWTLSFLVVLIFFWKIFKIFLWKTLANFFIKKLEKTKAI